MNILNIILISLILISLVVIIVIFGRILKRFKDVDIAADSELKRNGRKNLFSRIIGFFLGIVKNIFVVIAEWFVKKSKKVLHLVHFWLIKIRKGKKENGVMDEIEAKKQLIIEEEKSLELVINEDLAQADEASLGDGELKKVELTKERKVLIEAENQLEKEQNGIEEEEEHKFNKVSRFFKRKTRGVDIAPEKESDEGLKIESVDVSTSQESEVQGNVKVIVDDDLQSEGDQLDEEKKPSNFWDKIKAVFPSKREEGQPEEDIQKGFDDQFSDSVVKINKPIKKPNEEHLIKEVVRTGGVANGYDQDEELGVDRKILEKKILQKVASDPRSIENYRQLGELYIKMSNFDDADDAYKFILKLSPRDVDAKRKIEKIKLLKRLN